MAAKNRRIERRRLGAGPARHAIRRALDDRNTPLPTISTDSASYISPKHRQGRIGCQMARKGPAPSPAPS